MRKSKFRLHFAMTFVCAVPLLCWFLTAYERTRINISDDYFNSGNVNVWNQSSVYLNSQGTDWYWFFFLWDSNNRYTENPDRDPEIIDDPNYYISYVLEHNWVQIRCYEKLNWFYATNFTNFWMFPIDENTANKIHNWVTFVTWWLFADCEDMNGNFLDDGDGVFWYIKWQYGESWENTHEIRAWVTETWRKTESDLRLSRTNNHVALNGYIHDSLGKRSRVIANFNVIIDIPNQYFSQTKILSENVDEIYFLNQRNNWFWLFFLWTWIDGTFRITNLQQNETIICSKQINWYYSVSFHDFGMFPLDDGTRRDSAWLAQSWITILNGWLYYNCKLNGVQYTWVYGYIKWKHWSYSNPENTHELRVWMDSSGNWLPISPLEIIYSENSRNNNRALSGSFHSSIAKHWDVESRLFWDIWLTVSWQNLSTRSGKKLLIDYEYFWSNDFNVYVKSSIPWTQIQKFRYNATVRTSGYWRKYGYGNYRPLWLSGSNIAMDGTRTNMWFNWFYETGLQRSTGISNWYVVVSLTNNEKKWTEQISFELINTTPEITINRIPDASTLCTSGLIITATWNRNTQTIKYTIKDEPCTNHYTTDYEYDYTPWWIFLDDDAYNNKYICFMAENDIDVWYTEYQITWLDTTIPNITSISTISWYECSDDWALWQIISNDNWWCWIIQLNYERSGEIVTVQWIPSTNGFIFNINETSNIAEDRDIPFTLVDTAGNQQTWVITLSRLDIPITWHNYAQSFRFNRDINGNVNGIASEGNWKLKSEARAWSCETVQAEVIRCTNWAWNIDWDAISFFGTISTLQGWNWNCRLKIFDDDGSAEISVIMNGSCSSGCIDLSPQVVWWDNFVNRCFTWDEESLLSKGINGTFLNDAECNTFPQTNPSTKRIKKYTSWSTIQIELNPTKEGTPAQAYRVSCIQNETYCLNLRSGWNDIWCDDIYSWFFTEIMNCTLDPWTQCTTKYLTQQTTTCEWRENCSCSQNRRWRTTCEYQIPYTDCNWKNCTNPGASYYETILGCTYYCKNQRFQWNVCTRRNGNWERCTTRNASDIMSQNRRWEIEANIENYANQCRRYWNIVTNGSWWYMCEDSAIAWSDWIPYPWNSLTDAWNIIIERDLENWAWCAKNGNITMNWSKYLWERTVRIQLKDKNNTVSAKRETDIVIYDIPEYSGVVNYTTWWHFPRLSITDNKSISNAWIQQTLHVTDINRLYGVSWFSWSKTETEKQIMELYERYIKLYTYKAIVKSMTSERFEKWFCEKTIMNTWIFNVYMWNSCTCIEGDCIWDYQSFWLERHIPAVDNWCKSISATEITWVTVEERQNNQNIICEGEATYDENWNIIDSWSLTRVNCNTPTFDHRELKQYTDIQACDNACTTDRRWCYGNDDENWFGWKNHREGFLFWGEYVRDILPKEPIDACIWENLTQHTSNDWYECYQQCQNWNCYDNNWHKISSCLPQGTQYTTETFSDPSLCNAYCALWICYRYNNWNWGGWKQMSSCIGSWGASQSSYINDSVACNNICQEWKCYSNTGWKIENCISTVDIENKITYSNIDQCNFACNNSAEGCYKLNNQWQATATTACDSEYWFISYDGSHKRQCDNICQSNECYNSNDKNNNYRVYSCVWSGRKQSQNYENEETCNSFCDERDWNCYNNNWETITECVKANPGTRYFSGVDAEENCAISCQNGNCYDDNWQLTGSCTPEQKQKTFTTNKNDCTTSCNEQNWNCYDNNRNHTTECMRSNIIIESFTTSNRLSNKQNCTNALLSGNSFDSQWNPITSCQRTGLQNTGNYTNTTQCNTACNAQDWNCYDNSGNTITTCFSGDVLQTSTTYNSPSSCKADCNATNWNCYNNSGDHINECYTTTGALQSSSNYDKNKKTQCNNDCRAKNWNCFDRNGENQIEECYIVSNSNNLSNSSQYYYDEKAQCDAACANLSGNCYDMNNQPTNSCYGYNLTTRERSSFNRNKTTCDNECRNLSGNCYDMNNQPTNSCYTYTDRGRTYYWYKYYYNFRYKYDKNYSYQFKYYDTSYQYNYYNLTFKYFKDFYFGHYNYTYNYNDFHHKYYGDIHYNYYDSFYYYQPTHFFYKNKYYYYTYPEYYSYRANSYFYNTADSFYYNVPMYTKNWCSDDWYDYCTEYACTDYNAWNTYECTYSQCTDYWAWCLLYETNRVQTGTYLEDWDCECVLTATGSDVVDMDKIPSNELYQYGCISDPDNPTYAQCYRCAAWECNVRWNCLAYDSWSVTYFATEFKRERTTSNLKLTNRQTNFDTSWFIFQYQNGKDVMLSSITIQNQWTKWINDTDIKININFLTWFACVKEYWEDHCFECIWNWGYALTIPQNLITDFSLNWTNGLTIPYTYDQILTKPVYCWCDRSKCDDKTEYKYKECEDNCCYCLQHDWIKSAYDPRCMMGDGVFRAEPKNQISSPEWPQEEYTWTIDIYSTIEMNWNIEFIDGGNCPWFAKDQEDMCYARTGAWHPLTTEDVVVINTSWQPVKVKPDQLGINYKLSFHLSWIDNNWHSITGWDNCIIRFTNYDNKDNRINTELKFLNNTYLSFVLNTWFAAFKAWEVWQEIYYTDGQGLLKDAIQQYGWDNAFIFYISQPQRITINPTDYINSVKWTLWGITYDIDFNSTVANEVYNIEWRAIIDWYLKDLEITKPTYNYANPKWYLFTFPEYNTGSN